MTVDRIPVSSGGPEGTNSAYVLPDRGILVDPGPPGEEAWAELCEGLRGAGVALDAIDHVVATHWHADHVGLTTRLAAAADATIHMHERDAPLLADYAAERERRLRRDERTMRSWGVPADLAAAVVDGDEPSPLPDRTPVEAHADGDDIAGATMVHTPGHTAGHLALAVDGHLFVGDTVLPMYTPNVGGSDTRTTDPLASFLDSLDRLDRLEATVHPGHGTTDDLAGRSESIREHHRTRSRRVLDRASRLDRPTPWAIATDLFGEMRGVHAKFGAGEAAAHLGYLEGHGDVERVDEEPLRFESSREPESDPTAFE
ncbi:MBL fold metallo-hydrolase (plasmid) [Halobaculum sp. CBA1158]|uniref:MBL fold metallo-hydrolase n=1 Tax=Halobaculum sp. CBA1158 TaxID=2904243 RepID=UPI001F36778E|nr:MBL fold metallo-hydrolase [Halobaculum sp. CBA1158]UIP01513.1 MBL fold metallo-hydrolase [Halobaculum sp. CBA1158]